MPQKSLPIWRQGAFSHFLLGALQFQVLHLTSHPFPVNFCVCWKTGLVSFFCMWLTSVPSTTEEVTPSPLWMPGVPVGNWLATHTGGYFPALYSVPLLWMRFCASAMYDALMAKALWYNRKYDAELCSSSRLRSGLLWKTQIIRKIITQILELFFPISVKNIIGIPTGTALTLRVDLGGTDVSTLPSRPGATGQSPPVCHLISFISVSGFPGFSSFKHLG